MQKITRKKLRPFLQKYSTKVKVLEIGGGDVKSNHSYGDLFPNRHTFDIDCARKPDTVGDAHHLPFEDNSFEFILCTEVLEHLHSPSVAISEMKRVLSPGGNLVLTTRFISPIHDAPYDYYRFTEYGLKFLFKDWDIQELVPEVGTMSTIGALLQRVGFQSEVRGKKVTKFILYGMAKVFDVLNWVIEKEYGDIAKEKDIDHLMTTGYYLMAKND